MSKKEKQEDDEEIEINLNQFNFDGVVLEDLQNYIVEETDFDNLYYFFIELFSYCRKIDFRFEKPREISMISFLFENLEQIISDVDGDLQAKRILTDYIVFYILESENTEELIGLFTLVETPYFSLFFQSLEKWLVLHYQRIGEPEKIKKIQEELYTHIHTYSSM
jgi:hypothetical protein